MIGRVIAGHRIEALLGEGGMGVVYRARHERLGKVRALKLLPPQFAGDEDFRERFEREWRLAASIDHPNIVEVLDAGESDERLDDVGMVDRRGKPPLALEPFSEILVPGKLRRQQFEGAHLPETLVARAVDHAHPALAEKSFDPMAGDHTADQIVSLHPFLSMDETTEN